MPSSAPPKHQIRLRTATPADVPDIVRTHYQAFGGGVMGKRMSPGGASEDTRKKFGAGFFPVPDEKGPQQQQQQQQGEILTVVVELLSEDKGGEDGRPEIIAFGKFVIYREPRTEAEWNVARVITAESLGEGADVEFNVAFIGGLDKMRRKWMRGDPAILLGILACNPARGRLGAGSAILSWGAELADKEGLNMFLDASPQGYPLYKRFGFEAIDIHEMDLVKDWGEVQSGTEDWGVNSAVDFAGELPAGHFRTVMMKRIPKASRN